MIQMPLIIASQQIRQSHHVQIIRNINNKHMNYHNSLQQQQYQFKLFKLKNNAVKFVKNTILSKILTQSYHKNSKFVIKGLLTFDNQGRIMLQSQKMKFPSIGIWINQTTNVQQNENIYNDNNLYNQLYKHININNNINNINNMNKMNKCIFIDNVTKQSYFYLIKISYNKQIMKKVLQTFLVSYKNITKQQQFDQQQHDQTQESQELNGMQFTLRRKSTAKWNNDKNNDEQRIQSLFTNNNTYLSPIKLLQINSTIQNTSNNKNNSSGQLSSLTKVINNLTNISVSNKQINQIKLLNKIEQINNIKINNKNQYEQNNKNQYDQKQFQQLKKCECRQLRIRLRNQQQQISRLKFIISQIQQQLKQSKNKTISSIANTNYTNYKDSSNNSSNNSTDNKINVNNSINSNNINNSINLNNKISNNKSINNINNSHNNKNNIDEENNNNKDEKDNNHTDEQLFLEQSKKFNINNKIIKFKRIQLLQSPNLSEQSHKYIDNDNIDNDSKRYSPQQIKRLRQSDLKTNSISLSQKYNGISLQQKYKLSRFQQLLSCPNCNCNSNVLKYNNKNNIMFKFNQNNRIMKFNQNNNNLFKFNQNIFGSNSTNKGNSTQKWYQTQPIILQSDNEFINQTKQQNMLFNQHNQNIITHDNTSNSQSIQELSQINSSHADIININMNMNYININMNKDKDKDKDKQEQVRDPWDYMEIVEE